MSTTLIVKAHPMSAAESRTIATLDVFLTAYHAAQSDQKIQMLDLYHDYIPELDHDILSAWNTLRSGSQDLSDTQQKKLTAFNQLTEQFIAADKVVIANPMWNLSIPSRLKSWIDTVTIAGKTFQYTPEGPKALVSGKKVLHIQSNGGVYGGNDFGSQYVKGIMNFLGAASVDEIFIEGIDYNPDQKEIIMAAAADKAKQLATSF